MPLHDKALLEGICKHGIGRHDLMISDTELPFHRIVESNIEKSDISDPNLENTASMLIRIAWPKELVIQRRIDALCELILRPKQPQKRQIRSRKRKAIPGSDASASTSNPSGSVLSSEITPPPHVANRQYLSDVATDSEDDGEDEDDGDDNSNKLKRARHDIPLQPIKRTPTKPLKSQGVRYPPPSSSMIMARTSSPISTNTTITPSESAMDTPSTNLDDDEEMEEGEIGYSSEDDIDGNNGYMGAPF